MLYIDTSALVRRYLPDAHAPITLEAMTTDPDWVTSALTRTESQLLLRRTATGPTHLEDLWASFRNDWETMHIVPVDNRCLADAVEIGATHSLSAADSIQLAAATRLGTALRFLSLSSGQLQAAAHLGLATSTAQRV